MRHGHGKTICTAYAVVTQFRAICYNCGSSYIGHSAAEVKCISCKQSLKPTPVGKKLIPIETWLVATEKTVKKTGNVR